MPITANTDGALRDLVRANAEAIAANARAIETSQHRFERLEDKLENFVEEQKRLNDRVDVYQKASQQVVNLAFGLLQRRR